MSRPFTTAFAAALALATIALAVEPASAMPVAGAAALESAAPVSVTVDQVRFFRRGGFGFRRGYGYGGGYGYRRFGYRRGLPGHPIRRILRAL